MGAQSSLPFDRWPDPPTANSEMIVSVLEKKSTSEPFNPGASGGIEHKVSMFSPEPAVVRSIIRGEFPAPAVHTGPP
jgi:hypothetical protein